jgi:beta-glucosidase
MIFVGLIICLAWMAGCEQAASSKKEAVSEETITALIKQMTLKEKLALCHASSSFTSGGVPRLNLPELRMSDGPHGVRHEQGRGWTGAPGADDSASYLPTGIALASTWNPALTRKYGAVLGAEAKNRQKDIILGPGVNIIRTPMNGRNFEYFSEDPMLTSALAVSYIQGVQEQGVAACIKHFAANNQETNRNTVDVRVSRRALHEIYLPAFKAAVQEAGVWSVMGSYNRVNGQYTTHHAYLVNELLKGEWKFDGALISDWASVQDTREAIENGTDIEMGTELVKSFSNPDYDGFYLADSAEAMILRGDASESLIDEKVRRIIRLMMRTTAKGSYGPGARNTPEHQQVARDVAREGIVLLKNDGILPLSREKKMRILVVGDNATRKHAELGGSSQVKALYEVTLLDGIRAAAGSTIDVTWAQGYQPYYDPARFMAASTETAAQNRKPDPKMQSDRSKNEALKKEAVAAAATADIVIFAGGWIHGHEGMPWGEGTYDSEARDKSSLVLLFDQEALINDLAAANPNLIVALTGGSQVEMQRWLPGARAYIHHWYAGMEGGNAFAEILFGDVNPSGRLPVTFAESERVYSSHTIGSFPGNDSVHYDEGIFVGYRHFDTRNVPVVFPFGFGLSYTTFSYSGLEVSPNGDGATVSIRVKNTGNRSGADVVQVYVQDLVSSEPRPLKELKAFQKVFLEPGAEKKVTLKLPAGAFSYFSESANKWILEPGDFTIMVGRSVADIVVTGKITL